MYKFDDDNPPPSGGSPIGCKQATIELLLAVVFAALLIYGILLKSGLI